MAADLPRGNRQLLRFGQAGETDGEAGTPRACALAASPSEKTSKEEEDNLETACCPSIPIPLFVAEFNFVVKKYRTREQTETAQARAVAFAQNVLDDSDLADDLESLTPEEYADRKGIVITNPLERTPTNMANGNGGNGDMTKADLQDVCDEVQDILTDAYTPEASREELAAAIGDALDLLENGPTDDTDTDGDDDSDDDTDDAA
jgi:hypothetical protein